MSLEPKVIASIRSYRRKVFLEKTALLMPFFTAMLSSVAVLIFTRTVWYYDSKLRNLEILFSEHGYSTESSIVFVKVIAIALCAIVILAIANRYISEILYAKNSFRKFFEMQTSDYNQEEYLKFENALDGVSIAAGVKRPDLIVIDDPAPNALGCIDEIGKPIIAITRGLIDANIPVGEANAIMAHELSHIIIGENARPPKFLNLEFLTGILLLAFVVISLISIILAESSSSFFGVVAIDGSVFITILILERSKGFLVRLLNLTFQHSDELADSITVRITGDPYSLQNAIRRIFEDERARRRIPGGLVMARYLFVTPPQITGDYYRYIASITEKLLFRKIPRTWFLFSRRVNEAWLEILNMENRMTKERLTNLELIKQGYWRALDEWEKE